MIGLDTNVLVRYFAQDDAVQSKKATVLMESLSAERQGTFRRLPWWRSCGCSRAAMASSVSR